MASLIPGYEYDIFISYRQKDNKYDAWVTEFVDNLKRELEATFKDDISVYFDINPHNGLLETHDVDASLKEKLKCLVFIPILSRTYCDPKSFAWVHEFKAFVKQASQDQFGLRVKLPTGNIANRVLPVRIHDLEVSDIKMCETVIGGGLRGIEFIYKSAGVNRPLRSYEDHPHDNLNKIFYRDQINKVANAIDEIMRSIKNTQNSEMKVSTLNVVPEILEDSELYDDSIKNITYPANIPPFIRSHKEDKGKIFKPGTTWTTGLNKLFLTVLVIASITGLVFGWKGLTKKGGVKESDRELAKSHVAIAVEYFKHGNYNEARLELENALKNDPGYSYAWSSLAAVSVKQGKLNEAINQTIEAVKNDPGNSQAAYNMAIALDDKNDFKQATYWYREAIRIDSTLKKDSTYIPASSALGRLYNRTDQPIKAILLLNRARNQYPESKNIYLVYKNLGNAYLLQEQIDSALKYLELSKEINPAERETNLYLAQAYEASGEIARSIENWQDYIDLETDTIKIREAKNHLKKITVKYLQETIK
jgi:tetratricopeptide (TPR) repeat protein